MAYAFFACDLEAAPPTTEIEAHSIHIIVDTDSKMVHYKKLDDKLDTRVEFIGRIYSSSAPASPADV